MQLGSSPITGTPRSTNGASAASVRSASRFASSTLPMERKVRPQHSGRDPVGGLRDMHRVAAGSEHADRRVEILALEVAVESVGEEHDLPALSTVMPGLVPGIHVLL